jgi:hypothetical protein
VEWVGTVWMHLLIGVIGMIGLVGFKRLKG